MRTPANIKKHPIHPMLVAIPIGLWLFSLICDLVFVFGGGAEEWDIVAFYTMVGGIVGALCAAVPGFIDMLSLPAGLKRIALVHMGINLSVVALYAINVWLRATSETASVLTLWLSLLAVVMLGVSGWLGGKMVYVHGVAVETPPEPAPLPQGQQHVRA
jgi:uncharacterized membrane protein